MAQGQKNWLKKFSFFIRYNILKFHFPTPKKSADRRIIILTKTKAFTIVMVKPNNKNSTSIAHGCWGFTYILYHRADIIYNIAMT